MRPLSERRHHHDKSHLTLPFTDMGPSSTDCCTSVGQVPHCAGSPTAPGGTERGVSGAFGGLRGEHRVRRGLRLPHRDVTDLIDGDTEGSSGARNGGEPSAGIDVGPGPGAVVPLVHPSGVIDGCTGGSGRAGNTG